MIKGQFNSELFNYFGKDGRLTQQGLTLFSGAQNESNAFIYYNDQNFKQDQVGGSNYRWAEHTLVHEIGHVLMHRRYKFSKISFAFSLLSFIDQQYPRTRFQGLARQHFPNTNASEFIPEAFALDQMAPCTR